MSFKSHTELHEEWMRDPEYRAAFLEEEKRELEESINELIDRYKKIQEESNKISRHLIWCAYDLESERGSLQQTLELWRKEAGLTSAQVAEKMGVKPPTVSRMEKNATRMSYETLMRYANACGVYFRLKSMVRSR